MTNLEKIKNMTVEEMAEFLQAMAFCVCHTCKECKARFVCKPDGDFIDKIEKFIEVLNEEVEE